ncbi:MAG: acyl-CoA dehydrogenase family protein [Chloroflexi bacterium]|nr:acyl-CoA dehydrogenase family protein [Chloroflexota bacterium]
MRSLARTANPARTPAELVAAARALAPLARECAPEGDARRQLSTRLVDAMAEAGLFRIANAATAGGYEADPLTTIEVIEAIAEGDGAAGWTLMIGTESAGIVSGWLTEDACKESLLADSRAIFCGALNPVGRAFRCAGGWRVTGQWPFASGCTHSSWFLGGAVLYDGDSMRTYSNGVPRWAQFLVPRSEFTILDTWQVGGMRGSGSHDVAVADVFVPDYRTTDIYGEPSHETGPIWRLPLMTRLTYNKVAVSTGIARAAIDAFIALANEKTPRLSGALLRERPLAQARVAEAEATLRSARAFVMEAVSSCWQSALAGEPISREQHMLVRLASSHATSACVRAVELVASAAGVSANYLASPLERCLRDVRVVPQHITVAPQIMDMAGRIILGLDADSIVF